MRQDRLVTSRAPRKGVSPWSVLVGGLGVLLAGVALRRRTAPPVPVGLDVPAPFRASALARRLDPYREVPSGDPIPPPLPRGEIVDVPGRGEMFVRRADGPAGATPVLLLHGWMASADLNFFALYDDLAQRHPILAPDHRGHGRGIRDARRFTLEACADDAAALLGHLGIPKVVAVGYSMGGPIAMLFAARHPDLLSGLVLEATGLEWSGTRRERFIWRLMWLVGVMLRWDASRILLVRLNGGAPQVPDEMLRYRGWLEGEFRRGDPSDLAQAGRALGRFDGRMLAARIGVPVAVVITTKDELVLPSKQRELATLLDARIFEFPGDHLSAGVQGRDFAAVTLRAIAAVSPNADA